MKPHEENGRTLLGVTYKKMWIGTAKFRMKVAKFVGIRKKSFLQPLQIVNAC